MQTNANETPLFERYAGFTIDQWRFIAARLNTSTDKEAAEMIGVNVATPPRWPNKPEINKAVAELQSEAVSGAVAALKQSSLQAAMTIIGLMRSEDEAVRLRAAQDVLDRANGKASQRTEITGKDGDALNIIMTWGDG
jgi:hypothetical protein